MKKFKVVDLFVYLIVTSKAEKLFASGAIELFELHDDGSESLIENQEDLNECLENGSDIGISVGHLEEMLQTINNN